MPINPLSPEESALIAEPPSLLSRVGEQAANYVPEITNDMTRLLFNLGMKEPGQEKPYEFPKPYDIPPARGLAEGGVDFLSGVARALPLIASGEGAGAGVAELMGAEKLASRVIGSATGFGIQGATESRTQGALGAAAGSLWGLEDVVPKKYKIPAAAALGLFSGAENYVETNDPIKALTQGAVNAVLPGTMRRILKGRGVDKPNVPEVSAAEPPAPPGYRENIGLTKSPALILRGEVPTPEGALIREPTYSEGEALRIANLQNAPTKQRFQLSSNENLELPFSRNGNGAAAPVVPVNRLPDMFRPEGALIREPLISEGEALRKRRNQQQPVATLQPVVGPALVDKERNVLAVGDFTKRDSHKSLLEQATGKPNEEAVLDAFMEDKQHVFIDAEGNLLNRKQAAIRGKATGQLEDKTITEAHSQHFIKDEPLPFFPKEPKNLTELPSKGGPTQQEVDELIQSNRERLGRVIDESAQLPLPPVPPRQPRAPEPATPPIPPRTPLPPKPQVQTLPTKSNTAESKVATLQPAKSAEALPPPLPFEKPEVGSDVMVQTGLKGAEKERGTIISQDESTGITQVKVGDEVHDVWTSRLESAPKLSTESEVVPRHGEAVGGLSEFATIEEKQTKKTSGMKLRQQLGEIGSTQQDILNKFVRFIAAPVIGAGVGAAISDPDKRLQNALLFAVAAGGLGKISPQLIEAFARSHPDIAKAGTFGNTVKEFAKAAGEAAIASEKAATRASVETGSATGFEKIARWLNRRFTTAPLVQKALDKGHGLVDEISKVIEKGQLTLSNTKLSSGQLRGIQDFYEGKLTAIQLERAIGDPIISQAAMGIRKSIDVLQEMIERSLPEGELKTQVKNSFNKYLTQTFKIFHDPSFYPSEEIIQKVAKEIPGGSLENNVTILREYLNSVQVNRGIYGFSRKGRGYGEALGSILSRKDPDLSPAFKEMLGVYDSPLQQMAATANKLIRGARTAEFFNQLDNVVKPNGLKMSYSYEELAAARRNSQFQIAKARQIGDTDKVATLQLQLDDLNNYLYNAPNSQHGKLSAKFVDRRVHDSLMTYDSILTQSGSPINQAMTDITNMVKYAHTVASPLQFSRQVFSMPFLGLLAKTGPMDWYRAYNSLFHDPAELSRLRKLGLLYGDTVSGMLRKDFSEMLKGKWDQVVTNRTLREGIATWEEIYRTPDLITRISAFQKQEAKLLREGVSAAEATDRAIDFANQFAMNYGMAPKGIQIIRKIPFVNQYLTFAFEIARITKNLMKVAIGGPDPHGIGRPYAIGVLTAFATAPMIIQKLTESQLSPKDLEDWKKAEALLPDYSRSNFKFVTGRNAKGNFDYVDFTPIIVHDKWMKMSRDIASLDWSAFKADNPVFGWENTPLLNVATNQITGVDQHTKENLNSLGQRVDSVRRDLLPPLLGTDLDKILKALTPNQAGGLGITDPKTGQTASIGSIVGSYVTSLRSYTVSPTNLEQRAIAEATTQTANARAYAYRIMRSDAEQSVKDAARSYYQMVQKEIMMSLRDKLRKQPSPLPE